MQDDYARKLEDQKGLFRQLGIKLDALSIHDKDFDVKMRGYEKEEVDRFLDDVIVDYERFYDIITDLLDKYKEIQRRQAHWEEERKSLLAHKTELQAHTFSQSQSQLDAANKVDRRLVEDGIRQLERSLEQMKLQIQSGIDPHHQ